MTESCPVLTPTERQIVDIIRRAYDVLAAAVSLALEEATKQAAEDMRAIGQKKPHRHCNILRRSFISGCIA